MAKLTYGDLLNMAKSNDPNERKRGFGLFQAWVRNAGKLQDHERLTQMERNVLQQLFAQKGLGVKSSPGGLRSGPTGPRSGVR